MPASSDPTLAEERVVLPAHLHARPAGQLVHAATGFDATVIISYQDRTANAAGILAVLGLGATAGSEVVLRGEGPDAERAVHALAEVIRQAE